MEINEFILELTKKTKEGKVEWGLPEGIAECECGDYTINIYFEIKECGDNVSMPNACIQIWSCEHELLYEYQYSSFHELDGYLMMIELNGAIATYFDKQNEMEEEAVFEKIIKSN
jgi:hypothetical protein